MAKKVIVTIGGIYSGGDLINCMRFVLNTNTQVRMDMRNMQNSAISSTARCTVLYYKNS